MKVAILADIHSNIYALDVVLADCHKEAVSHFIVAGDLVGYYYWPKSVVQRLMHDNRVTCIRGNHEDILRETLDNHDAAARFRQRYGSGYDVCRETLSNNELEWLLQLPAKAELVLEGIKFSVHHGSPKATDEYIYPDAPASVLAGCFDSADYTILGHTHYSFLHHRCGRTLLNPGSVGQPRDIGGQACYVILDLNNHVLRFKRISYDISPLIAAAQEKDPNLPYLYTIMKRRPL